MRLFFTKAVTFHGLASHDQLKSNVELLCKTIQIGHIL